MEGCSEKSGVGGREEVSGNYFTFIAPKTCSAVGTLGALET